MTSHLLAQVMLSLALVVVIARVGGHLFQRIGQPPVVGEIRTVPETRRGVR